jgi:uncharacterized protein
MRFGGGLRGSGNVQDRRGMGPGMVGGGIGAVVLALLGLFLGFDPNEIPGVGASGGPNPQEGGQPPADDPQAQFVRLTLESTENTWNDIFRRQLQQDYPEPTLVLFSGATQSACGLGQAAMGPFYCPPDQQVYIDLSFFRDMETQLGAPGDFPRAYVIAHEVGHHVQNVLGISDQMRRAQQGARSEGEANQLSVMLELQADCFAGVWAFQAQQRGEIVLEPGDVEEAMNAASAIGDDRLQERSQGYAVPESFTHGSSAQRVRWFQRGLQGGDPDQCDTFNARQL